jgi:S1-C subfamily serine protease
MTQCIGYENKTKLATICDSAPEIGDSVLTVGSPFGLKGSLSQGIISGKHRALDRPGAGIPPVVEMIR